MEGPGLLCDADLFEPAVSAVVQHGGLMDRRELSRQGSAGGGQFLRQSHLSADQLLRRRIDGRRRGHLALFRRGRSRTCQQGGAYERRVLADLRRYPFGIRRDHDAAYSAVDGRAGRRSAALDGISALLFSRFGAGRDVQFHERRDECGRRQPASAVLSDRLVGAERRARPAVRRRVRHGRQRRGDRHGAFADRQRGSVPAAADAQRNGLPS